MIIAIDGPAGAGKSTVARLTAKRLKFTYIDTGAMYRALTLKVLEAGIDVKKTRKIIELACLINIGFNNKRNGGVRISVNGKDVSEAIRQPGITKYVSDIAKIKGVRAHMLRLQRELGHGQDSVLEGRDIGTVVFPDADKKFYIDAQFGERVKRRYEEMKNKNKSRNVTYDDVAADLRNRDRIDSTRKVAPLKKAKDAVYIDTTDMSINKVVSTIMKHIKNNR